MRVVLDTNVLIDDPAMVRDAARKVLELLGPARATLVFSPVVIAELERKRVEDIEGLRDSVQSRTKRLERLAGVAPAEMQSHMGNLVRAAVDRWRSRWRDILANPQVEVAEWPRVDSQILVERELARRRPSLEREAGTIGFRDTVIWLGILELATADPHDEILFVTADKGFLHDSGLHTHLLEDLDRVGSPGLVTRLNSMPALAVALQKEAESSGWEDWREAAVSQRLYERLSELGAEDFAEHRDARDGGMLAPTFDIGLPFTNHDWTLVDIDGPEDLKLEDAKVAPFGVNELTCDFIAEVHLSGFMDKFDWYSDDHPELDLWDADWNDYVVSVEATRRVRFRARIGIDDGEESVDDVELLVAYVVAEEGFMGLGS